MSKIQRARELRSRLLEMVAKAKREFREFDEDEQKEFDDKKNELIALSEQLKNTQGVLDQLAAGLPQVDDTADEKEEKASPDSEDENAPQDGGSQDGGEQNPDENLNPDGEQSDEDEQNPDGEEQNPNPDGEQSDEEKRDGSDEQNPDEKPDEQNAQENSNPSEINNDEKPSDSDNEDERKGKRSVKIIGDNSAMPQFSILKAVRSVLNGQEMPAVESAVIAEGEKEFRAAGLNYTGRILLPGEKRAVQVTGETGEHDDIIQTDFESILEPLYAKSALAESGVTFLRGLTNDVQIPVMEKQNVGWADELAEADETNAKFTSLRMSPKRLTAWTSISKQLIAQDSLSVEAAIRADLVNALNDKLEATVLGKAAGTSTQPAGIGNGLTATAVTDYKGVANFEAQLEATNLSGAPRYILSPTAKAAFRSMAQSTKATRLVFEGGELDGTPVTVTTNVAPDEFYYGIFNNVYVASWGGTELLVDPYSLSKKGAIQLVINAYFDSVVVRPGSVQLGTVKAGA